MITEEERYTCVSTSIRIAEIHTETSRRILQPEKNSTQGYDRADVHGRLFSLVRNAPTTFAERFPHLMVGVVAVGVLLAALTAEIDCLRGSGYYWQ